MVSMRPMSMRQSTALSIALHVMVVLIALVWSFWSPFRPDELTFDEVEIIDTQTFEALVAQSQAGSSGEDVADAPTASQEAAPEETLEPVTPEAPAQDTQTEETPTPEAPVVEEIPEETIVETIEETPAPEEPVAEEIIEETPPLPTPVPTVPVQPDNLPEPIFNPLDRTPAQPLPQGEEADRSGIAEPESEGQEQASEITTIPEPPARDAAQLREIASESTTPSVNEEQAEVVVQESEEAITETEAQDSAEIDATSSIEPEAEADAPITAAPEVAIAPPSRPTNLADAPLANTQTDEAPAPAVEDTSEPEPAPDNATADSAETTEPEAADAVDTQSEAAAVDTPAAGTDAENSSGTDDSALIDDLLNSVLEEDNGTESSGRGLSRLEEAALTQKIHNNWTKTPLIDKSNLGDLVVTVRFNTDRFGNLVGDIRMISPQNPNQDHWIAFRTAQNAILDSMPLEMPPDIDPNGVIWTINFDPASQNGNVN